VSSTAHWFTALTGSSDLPQNGLLDAMC